MVEHFALQRPDISEHHHAGALFQDLVEGAGNVEILRAQNLRKRLDRLFDVVERCEKRLRLLLCRTRNQTDALPLRTRVEQADGTRGSSPGNLEPCHLVPKFERQFESEFGRGLSGAKLEGGLAEPLRTRRIGMDRPLTLTALGPHQARGEFALGADKTENAEWRARTGIA